MEPHCLKPGLWSNLGQCWLGRGFLWPATRDMASTSVRRPPRLKLEYRILSFRPWVAGRAQLSSGISGTPVSSWPVLSPAVSQIVDLHYLARAVFTFILYPIVTLAAGLCLGGCGGPNPSTPWAGVESTKIRLHLQGEAPDTPLPRTRTEPSPLANPQWADRCPCLD